MRKQTIVTIVAVVLTAVLLVVIALTPEPAAIPKPIDVPMYVEAHESNKPTVQYVLSDEPLDDVGYKYLLQVSDLDGNCKYLYFNPDDNRILTVGYEVSKKAGGMQYSYFCVAGGRIDLCYGQCDINIDDIQIITSNYYLQKIN